RAGGSPARSHAARRLRRRRGGTRKGVGMIRRKRTLLVLLSVAVLALVVATGIAVGQGPDTSGLRKGTFKVGYGNNLSGFLAVHDHLISNGAILAIEQINAKGGVGGKVR